MSKRHISSVSSVIYPGVGSDDLHLGQIQAEVVATLGKPESTTRKYEGQFFYNYPDLGIEVDFAHRGGRVAYLFFFRQGVRGNRQADVITDRGIRPGDTREKVLNLLGDPEEKGAPTILNSGKHFGEWFSYHAGINLQFGSDGRVDMITITAARWIA